MPKARHTRNNAPFGLNFTDWLKREGRLTFAFLSGLSILSFSQNILHYLKPNLLSWLSIDTSKLISYCLHILVILFILIRRPARAAKLPANTDAIQGVTEETRQSANDALQLFQRCWMFLWLSFLFLYLFLTLRYITGFQLTENGKQLMDVGENLFGNCASIAFIFCYYILAAPAVSEDSTKHSQPHWLRWITIVIVLTLIDTLLTNFAISASGIEQFKDSLQGFRKPFNWFLGIAGATALALFVGRLDSKFINAPVWVIGLLYIYASIQPLYPVINPVPVINEDKISGAVLTNAAFFLKIILFLFVNWLLESGRILFYFVRVRSLNAQVDGDWQKFAKALEQAP
jgi:hypothetical protein